MKFLKNLASQSVLPYVAWLAVAILAVSPLFQIGVNSSDDFQYYVTAQRSWDYWAMDHYYYAISGRFYFLITKYFYYIPYLLDNFFAAKLIQYGTLFSAYLLFAYLVWRVLHSRQAAALTLLILLFNTVATPPSFFIAVTSYPFYFTFSLIIFLLGCLMYVNHYQCPTPTRHWRPWVGGALIFISFLFYETYIVFALMLGIYVFFRHWRNEGLKDSFRSRSFYHETLPLLLAAGIYLLIYFGYRIYLQKYNAEAALYDGTSFNAATFSIANCWRVLYRCAIMALPGQPYFHSQHLMVDNSMLLEGHSNTPFFVLGHASAATWACALLVGALLWWITKRFDTLSWKKLLWTALIGIAVALFAHTLISMSEKYNTQWASWIRGYVTTLFSYFGVALVLMAAVLASLKGIQHLRWQKVVRSFWCILIVFFAVLNGYSNEHISRALSCNQNRVTAINLIGESGFFDQMPQGSILYTDALYRISPMAFSITNADYTNDIDNLIALRANHKILSTNKLQSVNTFREENPEAPLYVINAIPTQKAGELLVVIAPVDSLSSPVEDIRTSHADLFYLSPEKHYTVVYTSLSGTHFVTVDAPKHESMTHCTLDDEGLNPWEIFISNMIPHNLYHE